MTRRNFAASLGAAALAQRRPALGQDAPWNIVLILADDLGYGDLSCYGSRIRTPQLDAMAGDGVLFRHFYSPSAVCSPARAGILTGRYGVRCGIPTVLHPNDTIGLPASEVTIPQMLKPRGYRSLCVGKWHLGRPVNFLPTSRGFDEYFGIPYSNDMDPSILLHNTDVVESPVNQNTLTLRYTEHAVDFIRKAGRNPFFLYFSHTAPHLPLAASPAFAGKSDMGSYGDVIQEMDWSVGQVLSALAETGAADNTLVIFTSDNGPWFQGSAGRLRGRKGDTFEGGMRVPFIARLGRVERPFGAHRQPLGPKTSDAMATGLDLLPTFAAFTGAALPTNRLDGVSIAPILTGQVRNVARPVFLYFSDWNLQCARSGPWKLHLTRGNTPAYTPEPKVGFHNLRLLTPELYNMDLDSEEAADVSGQHPDIVAAIRAEVAGMLPGLPGQAQAAWQATQARPVYPNEAGAYPVPIV